MRENVRIHEFVLHLPDKGLFYGEKALQEAIDDYERLHGPVKPKRKKGVDSILK